MYPLQKLFDLEKSIQATAFLLKQSGGKMRYLRLLKLLYFSNRESLKQNASLIVPDRACALPKGPILSTIYNLIKEKDSLSRDWQKFIETGPYHVFLGDEPDDGELSEFDKNILLKVYNDHRDKDDFDLVRYTHTLPEWKKHESALASPQGKNSYTIDLKDIVNAIIQESGNNDLWRQVATKVSQQLFYRNQIMDEREYSCSATSS